MSVVVIEYVGLGLSALGFEPAQPSRELLG
jgi:hypothetical protein